MSSITKIGRHKVRHGNVMDDLEGLVERNVDVFYSDPPWGQANLRYWETMRLKMNELDESERNDVPDLVAFLDRIMSLCVKHTKGYAVIEYGQKWREQLVEMARGKGMKLLTVVETKYRSGSKMLPLDLLLFSVGITPNSGIVETFERDVSGTHGYETVRRAFGALGVQKGLTVLDPCCGMGYTAQAAVDNGMTFRGNELNAARLAKTKARLEKDVHVSS